MELQVMKLADENPLLRSEDLPKVVEETLRLKLGFEVLKN